MDIEYLGGIQFFIGFQKFRGEEDGNNSLSRIEKHQVDIGNIGR